MAMMASGARGINAPSYKESVDLVYVAQVVQLVTLDTMGIQEDTAL
jgi:hypothetical protein